MVNYFIMQSDTSLKALKFLSYVQHLCYGFWIIVDAVCWLYDCYVVVQDIYLKFWLYGH